MNTKTGFVFHQKFLEHDTGPGHPEKPDRLKFLIEHLQQTALWDKLHHLIIDHAPINIIAEAHSLEHIRHIKEKCESLSDTSNSDYGILDQGDTIVCNSSFDVALLAAGGVVAGVDSIVTGVLKNVFCAVRPPGHHAESNSPMGFCLFNNVAVAAKYAKRKYGLKRILILDWDVHHGNGTQEIFYDDNSVFFISLHQYPFYPGSGGKNERGEGNGEGFNLNIPMRSGSGEKEYFDAFREEIIPVIDGYNPELIIISAGFDAHIDDPLANINLTENSFRILTEMVLEVGNKNSNNHILSVLEGGYNLNALSRSVETHLQALINCA